jgi:hypothetical protein
MFKVGVPMNQRIQKVARVGVVLAILLATCAIGASFSSAAPDPCQDVWQGATPSDPLGKVPSVTSAHPGDSVTYTFNWHSTGAANALLEDCYRVDDGSVSSLNAIVSGFYHSVSIPNVGDNGSAQSYEYTIQIPNDASLIGHSIVNRAKMPQGSTESRTDFVSVAITEAPCTENCGEVDGTTDGTTDGSVDGSTDGTTDGNVDGSTDGTTDGSVDGSTDGTTDGNVDGSTDGTTDGSVDGSTDGTTDGSVDGSTDGTTDGTVSDGSTDGSTVGNEVLGNVFERKPLATTGSETTVLAVIGFAMLMAGAAMRFGRFGAREVYATSADSSPADLLAKALRARDRDTTCGK